VSAEQKRVRHLQDEVAFQRSVKLHINEFRGVARQAQIGQTFIDHPAPKMAEMGELVVSKLQSTQHLSSTNDFNNDTLTVHSALDSALPQWQAWDNEELHVPMAEDAMLPRPTAQLAKMHSVTVVVRALL
jgi:hypothetical protein